MPLWKAFWLYGVLGTIAISYLVDWANLFVIKNLVGASIYVSFMLAALSLVYLLVIFVAVWRSSSKYTGLIIWRYTPKIVVIAVISLNAYMFYIMVNVDTNDPGKDSSNIESSLDYDENYPYVGFWKPKCSNGFGLAINKVDNGYYSVSFCGPGGCFKPGTYRPNTKLVNDPSYKVTSTNVIEVNGKDGFTKYLRCGL